MGDTSSNNSPASKSFATKLAQYAYAAPASTSPRRTPRLSQPASSSSSSSPLTPTRSSSRSSVTIHKAKRPATDAGGPDEEYADTEDTEDVVKDTERRQKKSKSPKKPRKYAGPEMYAHLNQIPDMLRPGLDLVFCGINPGKMSAKTGHHFAHPTNKFWRALHMSGLTQRLLTPAEGVLLPDEYNYGLTNLVDRPTAEQSELSTLEMRLCVAGLVNKFAACGPKVVCFVGKKIWDVFEYVAVKTASEARVNSPPSSSSTSLVPPSSSVDLCKIEPDSSIPREEPRPPRVVVAYTLHDDELVKIEPGEMAIDRALVVANTRTGRGRTPLAKKKKVAFSWIEPQALRLPLDGGGYTYFWVVPNTSGLERTLLHEQVALFTHLKEFIHSLQRGEQPRGSFGDIDVLGVARTVDDLRAAAVAKTKTVDS